MTQPVPELHEKERASRRTFDRWAAAFDRSRLLSSVRADTVRELDLAPEDRFLDVACGGGRLVLEAAPRVSRAAGLDISPRMLERARARVAANRDVDGSRLDFRVGSAQRLPFADGEFSVVACTAALHHFPEPAEAVAEIARVLAPGGRALLADLCTDAPPMRAVDALLRRFETGHVGFQHSGRLQRLLEDAGLTVTRTRYRLGRSYVIVVARLEGGGGAGRPTASPSS